MMRKLTPREREVLGHLAEGKSNKEIAGLLGISQSTVQNHIHNLLEKLGARSRLEAVVIYRRSREDQAE
jgi:two-component system, NarL family, nitrate/nitrite response regulator NarL